MCHVLLQRASVLQTLFAILHGPHVTPPSGGIVVETDAVAQAVTGHNDGIPDRLEVIKFLLDTGAPIDFYAYAKENPPYSDHACRARDSAPDRYQRREERYGQAATREGC